MKALLECHNDIINIYGYGVQVEAALGNWNKQLRQMVSRGNATPDRRVFFGSGDPNIPGATYQYQRTIRHLLTASAEDGSTLIVHRRNLIVLLYGAWEDRHRQRMAAELGLTSKNDIKSDVFSDIRYYRHAIIHGGGILRDQPTVLGFFKKDEIVSLTQEHIDIVFRGVIDELTRIGREYYETNTLFTLDQPLNAQ